MVQAAKITIYSNDGTKIEQSGEISRLYSIINEPHNTFRLAIVRDDIGSTETRMLNKALWNKQDILNLFEDIDNTSHALSSIASMWQDKVTGDNIYHLAAEYNSVKVLSSLTSAARMIHTPNSDMIWAKNNNGQTPFHKAAANPNGAVDEMHGCITNIMSILLECRHSSNVSLDLVNIEDADGKTAYDIACEQNPVAKDFLKKPTWVTTVGYNGKTLVCQKSIDAHIAKEQQVVAYAEAAELVIVSATEATPTPVKVFCALSAQGHVTLRFKDMSDITTMMSNIATGNPLKIQIGDATFIANLSQSTMTTLLEHATVGQTPSDVAVEWNNYSIGLVALENTEALHD